MTTHTIIIREDGEGYSKGEVVRAEFYGCAVDGERQEVAFLKLLDGARAGEKMSIPFRVFRFHEAKEVGNADQA